jgi:hypothetical protein
MMPAGVVDVEPSLHHFGASKDVAHDSYRQFVATRIKHGHCEEFYVADESRILGSEEFIHATIHRIVETGRSIRHRNLRLAYVTSESHATQQFHRCF